MGRSSIDNTMRNGLDMGVDEMTCKNCGIDFDGHTEYCGWPCFTAAAKKRMGVWK